MAVPKHRTCAHMVVHEYLAETRPDYRKYRLKAEEETRQSIESGQAMRVVSKLITIPVVVHVVHRTDAENISDAQVKSQIDALNRDFRAKNSDLSKVPKVWKSLVTDSNIQFALASKDPKGKKTSGITRTATKVASFGPENTVKAPKTGGVSPWPTNRYLNFWVCNLGRACSATRSSPAAPPKPTAW